MFFSPAAQRKKKRKRKSNYISIKAKMYCHCYSRNALLYFTGQLQHQPVGCDVEFGSSGGVFLFPPALPLDVLYCHVVDPEKHINKICAVWSVWCVVNYTAALSNLRAIGDAMSHKPSVVQFKSCGRGIDLCVCSYAWMRAVE